MVTTMRAIATISTRIFGKFVSGAHSVGPHCAQMVVRAKANIGRRSNGSTQPRLAPALVVHDARMGSLPRRSRFVELHHWKRTMTYRVASRATGNRYV